MKKVLIAYDGSEPSNRALQFVLDLPPAARPAEIHLLNVQEWPPLYLEHMTPMLVNDLRESQMASGHSLLEQAANRVASTQGTCRTHVLLGRPGPLIAEHADKLGCDHIVMGTRGLGAIKGLFLGSVATQVLHLCRLPLTLIK